MKPFMNNKKSDSLDSIYFQNYLKEGNKHRIDFKEIGLFLLSLIVVIGLALVMYVYFTNHDKGNSSFYIHDADDSYEFSNSLSRVSTQKAENDSKTATSESTSQGNETPLYLDQLALIETDRYTGNEGDSFVYPIGQHQYSHGVECTDGQNYDHGIEAWIARWNYSAESSWAYGVFQLDYKYTSLRGQCKLLQSYNTTDFNTSLEFWDGDTLLESYVITPDAIPFDISVDVTGCKELKVYFYDNVETSGGTAFALVNMELSCDDVESLTESTEDNMLVHSDAVGYGSNYYMLYSDVTASWEEAKQYCEQLGGHLAVINDADENSFLYNYMLNCGYESAYFGFIDENQDGNWKWVDGTTGNYTNWASGEPSSLSEPYGMYYYKFTDGTWNDGRWGDDTTTFICEWDSDVSVTSNADALTAKKTSATTTTITETTSELMSPILISDQDGHANIVNGGYACTDAYAYYFSDASGLYRMDSELNTRTLMTNRVFYLNIVQDALFFVNADRNNALCTIKTDGTGYQVLLDEYCYELTYYEGWLYFNRMTDSSNAICRIKPDGTGFTLLMECYEWYMSIAEDNIYFCNYDDGYKLYIMNMDGTNQKVLYDGECSDLCIADNKIYFSSDRTSRKLCSMNLDGTGFLQLTTTYTKHTNYHEGKIYFVSDDSKLYTCNPDGSNITKYADEVMTYPILTPGIIFYEDNTGNMFMMSE